MTSEEFEELFTATRLGWEPAQDDKVWVKLSVPPAVVIVKGVVVREWGGWRHPPRYWVMVGAERRVIRIDRIAPRFARES